MAPFIREQNSTRPTGLVWPGPGIPQDGTDVPPEAHYNIDPTTGGMLVTAVGGGGGPPAEVEVTNFPAVYPVNDNGGSLTTDSPQLPATLGQKTMANSFPVVVASDQSSVPVSGTVTANAGTNLNTSALNLEATQAAMSAKLPATLGQKTMANSLAVVVASDQSALPVTLPSSTTANTPVILTAGGDDIIAANASRKSWGIINLGTNPLYVRMANGATTAVFHIVLKAGVSNDDGNGGFVIDEIYKGVVSVAGTSPRFVVIELT